jgi:hypothetical protein
LCGRKNQNEILSCYALLHNWGHGLIDWWNILKNKGSFFIFHT